MILSRGKNIFACMAFTACLFFIRCSTESGTGTTVAGGSITRFTYSTGTVKVIVNPVRPVFVAAAVLFDLNETTGNRQQATELDTGVTATFPDSLTITLSDCSNSAVLVRTESYPTFKLYYYSYPDTCAPTDDGYVTASVSVGVTNGSQSKTISAGATASSGGDSGGGGGGGGGGIVHQIFVTSSTHTGGDFSGLSSLDSHCTTRATVGGLDVTNNDWKTLVSDSFQDVKDRITISGLVTLVGPGTVVATNSSDFWDSSHALAINYDETGTQITIGSTNVFTGSLSDGTKNGADTTLFCENWTDDGYITTVGSMNSTNGTWINNNSSYSCGLSARLYCISQPK